MRTLTLLIAPLLLGAGLLYFRSTPPAPAFLAQTFHPARFDYRAEAEKEVLREKQQPEEWEERSHGAFFGFPWRSAQAAEMKRIEALYRQNTARSNAYGPFVANWQERGPAAVPGRVTASVILPGQNRVYLLTDGGYLFRGALDGSTAWVCLNNQHPLGRGVDARLQVLELPGGDNRILAGGWDNGFLGNKYLLYSDDEGQSWQTPEGLPAAVWYRRTLAEADGTVWHMVRSDLNGPQMVLYRSTDFGQNFTLFHAHNLAQGDHDRRCDFWKPADSDTLFAVFEDHLLRFAPDGTAADLGAVTNQPNPEWAILTGGRAAADSAYTLYLRVWDGTENGIYRSTDNGASWAHWGALPDGGLFWPFSNYAFATDPGNPSRVYAGGWILGWTDDGANWTIPHDLGGYVGYHGDVPDIQFIQLPGNNEHTLFIGTDGGYYEYEPSSDEFVSHTLYGLGNTQIYRMASSHTDENLMYIGTQDNGFCYNHAAYDAQSIAPYSFLWGGDVTQLVSADGGQSFWCFWWGSGCNYVQDAANIQSSGVANWGPVYDSEYWEIPAKADPMAPDECLVAGYITPSPEGSYLVRLKAPDNLEAGQLLPLEQSYGAYDFKAASGGGRIGAIGISPLDNNHLYVMTDNGVFFWSLDKGLSWQKNEAALGKIWPRYIAVSPTTPGEVFIGGAGYGDNTPCWRSTDHGQTLVPAEAPAQSALRDNRVNGLCFDPEGQYVFAAADIGAFVYVIAEGNWQLIGGDPAPLSAFHDAEYLPNSQTVRFATFSRGVWDFQIQGLVSGVGAVKNPLALRLAPNPVSDRLRISCPALEERTADVSVFAASGKLVFQNRLRIDPGGLFLPVGNWPTGNYTVRLQSGGKAAIGRFLKL